jgi:hypothetical protein
MGTPARHDGRRESQPGATARTRTQHPARGIASQSPAAGAFPGDGAYDPPLPLEGPIVPAGVGEKGLGTGASCGAKRVTEGRRWVCQRPSDHLRYSRRHEVYRTGTAEVAFGWEDPE